VHSEQQHMGCAILTLTIRISTVFTSAGQLDQAFQVILPVILQVIVRSSSSDDRSSSCSNHHPSSSSDHDSTSARVTARPSQVTALHLPDGVWSHEMEVFKKKSDLNALQAPSS
jgi:hypothetical protein